MGTGSGKWYSSISIILVVLISILGVLMAGLMLLLVPSQADVLRDAVRRTAASDRVRIEAKLEWRGERRTDAGTTAEAFVADAVLSVNAAGDGPIALDASYAVRPREGAATTLQGELLRSSGTTLHRFPLLPEYGGVQVDAVRGRWLRVDLSQVLRHYDLPLVGAGRTPLPAEERRSLVGELVRTPFLAVRHYVNTDQLADGPAYHQIIDVEPLFVKDVLMRADEAKLGRPLVAKERAAYDALFADAKIEGLELWLNTRDHLPRRAVFDLRIDGERRSGRLRVDASLAWGTSVTVRPLPVEDVIDATPILLSLLPRLAGGRLPMAEDGTLPRGTTAARPSGLPVEQIAGTGDADGDGLTDILEAFYGSSSTDPDSDDDGVTDGVEVEAGQSPTGPYLLFDFTGGRFR